MRPTQLASSLLRYILESGFGPGDKLPTIKEISEELNVSVAKIREELEVARAFGLLDIKPGRGMLLQPYTFTPAIRLSALYAIGQDPQAFDALSEVRTALEITFWKQAVSLLDSNDFAELTRIIQQARQQLNRSPIVVPYQEHRDFHLIIFSKMGNPFVTGFLETYWDAYDAFGLALYAELSYHHEVWDFHQQIVDAIEDGNVEASKALLVEHIALLRHRDHAS